MCSALSLENETKIVKITHSARAEKSAAKPFKNRGKFGIKMQFH